MQMEFYCDLYVSECWQKKKARIIRKLRANRVQPQVYVVQHVFAHADLFVVGIADGYDEALAMVRDITEEVYTVTGKTDLRKYILERQEQYVKAGQ